MFQDSSKTQCKICLKFINIKSLSKHMSAFHKESVTNLNENNNNHNNNNVTSAKSRSRARSNNNPANSDKVHGCQYCKKSFVSPAKLRLHTAKFHAEERLHEVQPPMPPLEPIVEAGGGGQGGGGGHTVRALRGTLLALGGLQRGGDRAQGARQLRRLGGHRGE